MKVPESDMPDEALWQSFFDTDKLLKTLLHDLPVEGDAVELGAGYGTFTQSALKSITGTLHAYEIESELCTYLETQMDAPFSERLQVHCSDVLANGTGLKPNSISLAMVFNLLHFADPSDLLNHIYDILIPGGRLLILHWRSDLETPRGPDKSLRPSPNDVSKWCQQAGFGIVQQVDVSESCPWHFSVVATK